MRKPVGDNGAVGQFRGFVGRAQFHDGLVIGVIPDPRRPVNFLRHATGQHQRSQRWRKPFPACARRRKRRVHAR